MKNNMKYWQRIAVMLGIVLCMTIASVPKAVADERVYPPDKAVYGMTYGDWAAAWWQYVLSIPAVDNPLLDETGAKCDVGQGGPVFFLVGVFNESGTATRTCTVPAGKALFFPVLNYECDNLVTPPTDPNEWNLRTCAAEVADLIDVDSLKVTVDGKKVKKLEDFRVQSPVFNFFLPAGSVVEAFGYPPGPISGKAVTDGYYVMLKPLSPGNHVVHFEGSIPAFGFTLSITYNLTITP